MTDEKKPIYCLANKEIIENHEARLIELENGGGGSYVAGDGISIIDNVIANTKPNIVPNISQQMGKFLRVDGTGTTIEFKTLFQTVQDNILPNNDITLVQLYDLLDQIPINTMVIFNSLLVNITTSTATVDANLSGSFIKHANGLFTGICTVYASDNTIKGTATEMRVRIQSEAKSIWLNGAYINITSTTQGHERYTINSVVSTGTGNIVIRVYMS